jgi:hypothetical protein
MMRYQRAILLFLSRGWPPAGHSAPIGIVRRHGWRGGIDEPTSLRERKWANRRIPTSRDLKMKCSPRY